MRFILPFFIILLFSCKKEISCESCVCKEAIILYTGELATDGCDWVVKIDPDHYYHPDALPGSFKQDNLAVQVCYELTEDEFICGIAGMGMPVIHISSISK